MPKLSAWIGGLLVLTAASLCAEEQPYVVPFEVGQRVEIALAKPYRTAEGVRIDVPWGELAGKDLLTLVAGGRERTLALMGERGRVQGLLTAVDDAGLTLDLGEQQPLLRVPRAAIVRWETLGLAAQGAEPLPTGRRVRLFSKELGTLLTGRLRAIDDETLLVKVDDRAEPLRLRRASIEQIEVSRGERSRTRTGAVIGAVALGLPLAVAGAFFGGMQNFERPAGQPYDPNSLYIGGVIGLCVGAGVGGAIGAAIGNASKVEHWERGSLSVVVAPRPHGGRAALALRF